MSRVRERRLVPARAILLDTHALVWWIGGERRLRPALRRRIGDPSQRVYVSAATSWELSTKVRLGKLPEAMPLVERLAELIDEQGFEVLPISLEDGRLAGSLPSPHRDPFDRMLAAQAMLHDLELVSMDPAFSLLGIEATW
ncbi:MAG TPA: type II toxin-antitoxin system VapC family toxin [Gemmatimonadales bacterium]|nr:type II toxin-antitoxin system VapC family toxin [Gemmatimonadales bacterium]